MRIGGSTIAMTSQRKYSEYKSIQYAEYNGLINERVSVDPEGKEKSLFDQIKDAAEQKNMKDLTDKTSRTRGTIVTSEGYKSLKSIRELRMALLENIINAFARRNGGGTELTYAPLQQSGGSTTYIRQTVESGFYKEEENTAFVSEGKVITKDGREINFNVSFEMSRSFQASYEAYSESTYVLCDPLVFNFEGNTADITDQKFMFDLDCDGKEEEISSLGKGSGFLALDKNGDGIINDYEHIGRALVDAQRAGTRARAVGQGTPRRGVAQPGGVLPWWHSVHTLPLTVRAHHKERPYALHGDVQRLGGLLRHTERPCGQVDAADARLRRVLRVPADGRVRLGAPEHRAA